MIRVRLVRSNNWPWWRLRVPQLAAGARTLVTPVAISLSFDTCQNFKMKNAKMK
jgi:hypothetical protein